jgi:uncharacterized repeat protein (TIGR02543 family)
MTNSDVTVTANYQKNTHRVTVNSGTGTGTYSYLDTVTITANDKYGYHFTYWTGTDNDGNSITFTNKSATKTDFIMTNSDVTVTANYSPNTYTISYNNNSGSGSIASQKTKYDTPINLSDGSEFTKTGYKITGWATSSTGKKTYDLGAQVSNLTPIDNAEITLYAYWQINTYTVTFNSDGGSFVSAKTVTYLNKVTKPSDPIKKGYTFAGWYTSLTGGTLFDFNKQITENITLYAHWNKEHKVTTSKKAKTTSKEIKITGIKFDSKTLKKGKTVKLLFNKKKIKTYKLTKKGTLIIKSKAYKKFLQKLKQLVKKKYKKTWKKHYKKGKWISITLSYGSAKSTIKVKVIK